MKTPPDLHFVTQESLRIVPIEEARTIPSAWYTDSRFLELERQTILSSFWHYVGHEGRIPSIGDQIVAELPWNPVVVVRGNDGVARAFYNVCRHRGGPIAVEDCRSKMLQCKYHGWTYTLEGQLRGVPRFGRSDLFDKKDYGLVPLTLESWNGLLFARSAEQTITLDALLDGVGETLHGHSSLSSLRFYRRAEYVIKCNWKVYVDNYLEGYHVPLVHPSLNSILDYQQYKTSVREFSSLQQSPLSADDHSYGIQSGGQAFYFFIFPNFMLNILPGRMQTNLVIPISYNETKVVFEYYYEDASKGLEPRIEEDIRASDLIQKEDVLICEHVQRGLSSSGYDQGRFSPEMETGVYHFQSLLKRELGKGLGLPVQ